MGLIKDFLLVVVSVLLFVSLLTSGIFLTLGLSLNYDNVNSRITPLATNIIQEQIQPLGIEKYLPLMKTYCKENPKYVFSEQGYNFSLSCDKIPNSTQEFINSSVKSFISNFYYKEYSCSFWKCFQEEEVPLFLVSKYAQDYWMSSFYKMLIISLILVGLIVFLVSKKSNGIILIGSLFVGSSLIISKLDIFGTKLAKILISPVLKVFSKETSQQIISKIVSIFFLESSQVFLWFFVIGLILIGIGILFKIFKIGFKISKLFKKVTPLNKGGILKQNSSNSDSSKKDSGKEKVFSKKEVGKDLKEEKKKIKEPDKILSEKVNSKRIEVEDNSKLKKK